MSEFAIAHLSGIDAVLGGLIRAVGPYALAADLDCAPFQSLAQAIAHQQLNGTAARTILARFVNVCGNGAFPTPESVLATPEAALRGAGFSYAKIASLRDLAAKSVAGIVPGHDTLHALGDAEIIERLTQVRGIGRWTVEMLLIFRLGRPDILPVDDFGVRNGFRLTYGLRAMPSPAALAVYGERWGPYRTAAAWYLWRAVELARVGKLPQPAERIRLPRVRRKRRAGARKRLAAKGAPGKARPVVTKGAPGKARPVVTKAVLGKARPVVTKAVLGKARPVVTKAVLGKARTMVQKTVVTKARSKRARR